MRAGRVGRMVDAVRDGVGTFLVWCVVKVAMLIFGHPRDW